MTEHKISLCMIVKNEEKNLIKNRNHLLSILQAFDEFILIDTGSKDSTKEIVQQLGATVFEHPWIDDFSAARNFGVKHCNGSWIFMLDADEIIATEAALLRKQLKQCIFENKNGLIEIFSTYEQNNQVQIAKSKVTRFFPKDSSNYEGAIHEQVINPLSSKLLRCHIDHDGYHNTNKAERNQSLLQTELEKNPEDVYILFQLGREYKKVEQYELAQQMFEKALDHADFALFYVNELVMEYLYVIKHQKKWIKALSVINAMQQKMKHIPDFHFVSAMIYLDIAIEESDGSMIKKIEQTLLHCLSMHPVYEKNEIVQGTSSFLAAHNLSLLYHMLGNTKLATHYDDASKNFENKKKP
jgi:glycosyltransferase involved in cell wall biosynthesis